MFSCASALQEDGHTKKVKAPWGIVLKTMSPLPCPFMTYYILCCLWSHSLSFHSIIYKHYPSILYLSVFLKISLREWNNGAQVYLLPFLVFSKSSFTLLSFSSSSLPSKIFAKLLRTENFFFLTWIYHSNAVKITITNMSHYRCWNKER